MPTPDSSESHPGAADQALVSLRRIVKVVDARSRTLARDTSLTPSQLVVLTELAASGSAQPRDLSRSSGLKQATISVLLDRLQERGLIIRIPGEFDRRTVQVQITETGRRVLAEAPDLLQVEFDARFRQLADWEQAQINAVLLRLVSLLDASSIDAAPVLDVGTLTKLPTTESD